MSITADKETLRRYNMLRTSVANHWIHPSRLGTLSAIMDVMDAIPTKMRIPFCILFAPSIDHAGTVYRPIRSRKVSRTTPIIYLAPVMEIETSRSVRALVAEELAHVVLGHHRLPQSHWKLRGEYKNRPIEIEAKALGKKWGFSKSRKRFVFPKMLEFWIKKFGLEE